MRRVEVAADLTQGLVGLLRLNVDAGETGVDVLPQLTLQDGLVFGADGHKQRLR